jgi:hypothetical protein
MAMMALGQASEPIDSIRIDERDNWFLTFKSGVSIQLFNA